MKTKFNLDTAADSELVSLKTATAVTDTSRATLYRHHKAGRLPFQKVGKLTRITVGNLRRLIGGTA